MVLSTHDYLFPIFLVYLNFLKLFMIFRDQNGNGKKMELN